MRSKTNPWNRLVARVSLQCEPHFFSTGERPRRTNRCQIFLSPNRPRNFFKMATTVVQTVQGQRRAWTTGLFDCFSDMGICVCGYFCGPCLLCQNANDLGENGCALAFCIPCPYNQTLLRVKIRSENNIEGNICDDYCTTICCSSCALCQEAREIKYLKMNQGSNQQVTVITTQPEVQPAQPVAVQPGYAPQA